jgi:hypothetical protein
MVRIIRRVTWLLLLTAFLMSQATAQTAQTAPPQAPPIEPKAIDILKASCDVLAAAKAMSFTAVSTYERAARNGQPLFYATKNEVTLQRPNKLRVITPGDGTPDEFYYDGKSIMAYVPSQDLVAVADAPPTIDQMVDVAWHPHGYGRGGRRQRAGRVVDRYRGSSAAHGARGVSA